MKIAILGTGDVGQALGTKLALLGHEIALGTRDVDALRRRDAPRTWLDEHATIVPMTFADAAAQGEMVFLATAGEVALDVLAAAGTDNLAGKVLVDVSNPLDFSGGFPPRLSVANDDSLAEQIQRAAPAARVVKTLNTVTAALMVDPRRLADGAHTAFVSGDDAEAKRVVMTILTDWFGWTEVIDLGDISTARGTEMWLALWVRLMQSQGTGMFNLKIVRQP